MVNGRKVKKAAHRHYVYGALIMTKLLFIIINKVSYTLCIESVVSMPASSS